MLLLFGTGPQVLSIFTDCTTLQDQAYIKAGLRAFRTFATYSLILYHLVLHLFMNTSLTKIGDIECD